MNKREIISGFVLGFAVILSMTGCTNNQGKTYNTQNRTGTSEILSENLVTSENSSQNTLHDGEEIVEGAFVNSISCGYLGSDFVPEQYVLYLITNEEEVAYAEVYLGMQVPLNVDEIFGFNRGLAEQFQKMKEDYPITEYNYLLEYLEYSQGGHYHHADSVIYKEDIINFHYDVVKEPDGEFGTDVMEGDLIMAAVPKTFFEGKTFVNVARYGIPLIIEGENIKADDEVKEGFIATFECGNPDYVSETFVYKIDEGYKLLHSHNAYILGTSKWERTIEYYAVTPTKEGVLMTAKDFGTYEYVRYPGDDKFYEPEDFLNKDFVKCTVE